MTKFRVWVRQCLATIGARAGAFGRCTMAACRRPALAAQRPLRGRRRAWRGYPQGWFRTDRSGVIAGAALGTASAALQRPVITAMPMPTIMAMATNVYYDTAPSFGVYNNNGYYNNNPNGFVCQPGTVFKGEDGRPHLCQ